MDEAVKEPREEAIAVFTVRNAASMTPEGRKLIADWMREKARDLEKHGEVFAPGFRARYLKAANA